MKAWIRAEDFVVNSDGSVNLGGRIIRAEYIVSYHFFQRLSLELIGFGLIQIATVALLVQHSTLMRAWVAADLVTTFLVLGIWREHHYSRVLVIQVLQEGLFEVRGFTGAWAMKTEIHLAQVLNR